MKWGWEKPTHVCFGGVRSTGPECHTVHRAPRNSKGHVFAAWELTWTRKFSSGAPPYDAVCCGFVFLTFNVLARCLVVDGRGCS